MQLVYIYYIYVVMANVLYKLQKLKAQNIFSIIYLFKLLLPTV